METKVSKKEKRQAGEAIFIRVDADLKLKLEKLAQKDQRNLADFIRVQLRKITLRS